MGTALLSCCSSLLDYCVQTVKNLFDTSFLVHRGSLEIGIDAATSLPYLGEQIVHF